jgi:hypothetical protein
MKELRTENLSALVRGVVLTTRQKADAAVEYSRIFEYIQKLEEESRCEHKGKKWIQEIAETYCPMCREIL